jgi:hypothetical protein
VATVPETKKCGFTVFVPTNDVLINKYGIDNMEKLYQKACEIYDAVYPDDANQPYHAFDQLTDRRNPLNRFIAYHILTRDVKGWDYLTPLVMSQGVVQGAIGIHIEKMNPIDWYETLLPHTMMKFEQLTMDNYLGNGIKNERYINRRYDDEFQIEGAEISQTIEEEYIQDAPNGRYFYINDIAAFSKDVRDKVQNMRIRMDFSTIFPEIMTNDIRLNGDPTKDDNSSVADESYKYGRNYYFPQGYLSNVTLSATAILFTVAHTGTSGHTKAMSSTSSVTTISHSVFLQCHILVNIRFVLVSVLSTLVVWLRFISMESHRVFLLTCVSALTTNR